MNNTLDTFDDLPERDDEDRCIDTLDKPHRALARLNAQDEQNVPDDLPRAERRLP